MRDALEWARTQVEPALTVAEMARRLSLKRTTYDSMEKGTGKVTQEILEKVGSIRGLPKRWYEYADQATLLDDVRRAQRPRSGVAAITSILVPSLGPLTRADLRTEEMHSRLEPIRIPANFAPPGSLVAIAEAGDTMPELEEGTILVFTPIPKGEPKKVGKRYFAKLPSGKASLRSYIYDGQRMVCRAINPAKDPDVDAELCDLQGLWIGWLTPESVEEGATEFFGRSNHRGL